MAGDGTLIEPSRLAADIRVAGGLPVGTPTEWLEAVVQLTPLPVASPVTPPCASVLATAVALVSRWTREDVVVVDVTGRVRRALASAPPETDDSGRFRIAVRIDDGMTHAGLAARMLEVLSGDPQPVPASEISGLLIDATDSAGDAVTECLMRLTPEQTGIRVRISGSPDRFDQGVLRRIADGLGQLHRDAGARPGEPVTSLEIVTPAEREFLLEALEGPRVPRSGPQRVHRIIEQRAATSPDAIAVEHGSQALTYAQLNAAANLVAERLAEAGVGPGAHVAIFMPRSLEVIATLLGVLKAGAAFIPLDPQLPDERVRSTLVDASCAVLVVDAVTAERGRRIAIGTSASVHLVAQVDPAVVSRANPIDRVADDDLAYILYTSGSTGRPKGVRVPHRALANHALWFVSRLDMVPADRMLQHASIGFDAAMAEIFAPLACGATVVLAPVEDGADLRELPRFVGSAQISVMQLVPSAMRAVVTQPDFGQCLALRYLVSGGEALDGHLAQAVREALPGVRLGNFYGPTEATIDAASFEVPADAGPSTAVPIGFAIANGRLRVLDAHRQLVPVGVPGELYVGGTGVALGYHDRAERTAAHFSEDPFLPGERLYRTGDLVRVLPDGAIEYLGRIDRQVKLRGYRIEMSEIEAQLLQHPGVAQVTVHLHDAVDGDPFLVAWFVPQTVTVPTRDELREWCRRELPSYMIPSVFQALESLPLTVNGKLDVRALPPLVASKPADAQLSDDPIERSLQEIWQRVLGVSSVAVEDDFFALGGHSLKAIRLLSEIEAAHGIELRAAMLFEAPTVQALAEYVRSSARPPLSTLVPVQPHGSRPPLFFAPGGGGELFVFNALARALGPDQPVHVLDIYVFDEIELPSNPITLEDIAARMVEDILRVQPAGPYHLAGYSLGGKIVYEIAQQLRSAGHEVAMLALLDCNGPGYPHLQPFLARTVAHLRHARAMRYGALDYLATRVMRLRRYLRPPKPTEVRLFTDEAEAELIPDDVIQALEAVLTPVVEAWERYEPQRYDGPVVIVRAAIRFKLVGIVDDDPLLGWGRLIGGEVRLEHIECDHYDLVRPEFADALAEILLRSLAPASAAGDETPLAQSAAAS